MSDDVKLLYPTPVLLRHWPLAGTHNPELREQILAKRAASGGVQVSNRGGWQSKDDLLAWGGPAVTAFIEWIRACVFQIYVAHRGDAFAAYLNETGNRLQLLLTAWANINGRGNFNTPHNHPGCHWSGVYYVDAPPGSGLLALQDPRPNINMANLGNDMLDLFPGSERTLEPREGLTVVFPSWLQHGVTVHESDEERISIAFNVRFWVS